MDKGGRIGKSSIGKLAIEVALHSGFTNPYKCRPHGRRAKTCTDLANTDEQIPSAVYGKFVRQKGNEVQGFYQVNVDKMVAISKSLQVTSDLLQRHKEKIQQPDSLGMLHCLSCCLILTFTCLSLLFLLSSFSS